MKAVILAVLVLGALALVSHLDYRDQQAQHDYQCSMIEDGHWPESVNSNCNED